MFLWTDASLSGYGAHTDSGTNIQGRWSEQESTLHINALELLAIRNALRSHMIPHQASIALSTDNQVAHYCLKNWGSNKSQILQQITLEIFQTCENKKLVISSQFIPGQMNATADALSRDLPAPNEWSIPITEFQSLTNIFFLPEIDLMATPFNRVCEKFISPYPHQEAEGVDFFMQDLTQWKRVYIFPPVKLIKRVLQRLQDFRGEVMLIAPIRPLLPWYPMLLSLARASRDLSEPPFQRTGERTFYLPHTGQNRFRAWIF
jgi:ribonuclease HI